MEEWVHCLCGDTVPGGFPDLAIWEGDVVLPAEELACSDLEIELEEVVFLQSKLLLVESATEAVYLYLLFQDTKSRGKSL